MAIVMLDLPTELYKKAAETAQSIKRPLEEVVIRWIKPTDEDELREKFPLDEALVLQQMEKLSNEELTHLAKSRVSTTDSRRVRHLFKLRSERGLNTSEEQELYMYVRREDKLTLQKARALLLLSQRGVIAEGASNVLKFLSS